MARAIRISTDGTINEVNVDVSRPDRLFGEGTAPLIVRPDSCRDAFTDIESGSVVLITKLDARIAGDRPNMLATALVVRPEERDSNWIAGDVYVLGEDFTVNGVSVTDLPERVGVGDIAELIEYCTKH